MKMPFGMHKGKEVSDIPTKYLRWVLGETQVHHQNPALETEIERVLQERADDGETE
jgi:hypothetical protein